MKKIPVLLFIGIAMMIALAACGGAGDTQGSINTAENNNGEETESNGEEGNNEENSAEGRNGEEMTVEHDLGETTVPINPQSAVVFDLGVADTILEIGGHIDGVPNASFPDHLSELADYENVGSFFEPDFETVYALQPDVIFIGGRTSDHYDELSEIAPTVLVTVDEQDYLNSFEKNMRMFGQIYEAEDEVETQLADIREIAEGIFSRAEESGQTALFLSADEGSASAYGEGSRFGIIHDDLGIPAADPNIESENHGENVSFEYIADVDPDYIFVMDRGGAVGNEATAADVINNELVDRTQAAQNDNIYEINSEVWYLSSGGLQSVRLMVEEIDAYYE